MLFSSPVNIKVFNTLLTPTHPYRFDDSRCFIDKFGILGLISLINDFIVYDDGHYHSHIIRKFYTNKYKPNRCNEIMYRMKNYLCN